MSYFRPHTSDLKALPDGHRVSVALSSQLGGHTCPP